MSPSESQLFAISTTERVCSAVSLAATSITIVSFICSGSFRKPFNRLVFYASWGNIMANLATVISREGIHAGRDSPLCQFQAFLIQWWVQSTSYTMPLDWTSMLSRFTPADALWALAMACNVYLTFFRKYDSDQLRRLEWKYCAFCYGLPFIPAFAYFFIHSRAQGKIYGSAIVSDLRSQAVVDLWTCWYFAYLALVLDYTILGLPADCHVIRPCLVYHLLDPRPLYAHRLCDLSAKTTASPDWNNPFKCRVPEFEWANFLENDRNQHHSRRGSLKRNLSIRGGKLQPSLILYPVLCYYRRRAVWRCPAEVAETWTVRCAPSTSCHRDGGEHRSLGLYQVFDALFYGFDHYLGEYNASWGSRWGFDSRKSC